MTTDVAHSVLRKEGTCLRITFGGIVPQDRTEPKCNLWMNIL